jgi:hypothetical protein
MPRDAKRQQEEIWTNSRVTLHHVQGLLPLPLPFKETKMARGKHSVKHSVPMCALPKFHTKVFLADS